MHWQSHFDLSYLVGKECKDFEDRWKSIDVVGAYFTSSLSISYGEAFTSTFEPHFT